MKFSPTSIPEVIVIEPLVHKDARGFLLETWRANRFQEAGIDATFVQDVHSQSSRDTLRGIHYQVKHAQGKLVRAVRGEVRDVAVDLRKSSPTFGLWVGETLSEENHKLIWIPPGFGHGFMVLSESADIEYRMTNYYAPEYARTILWSDPDIGIAWPSSVGGQPLISEADSPGLTIRHAEVYA